MKEVLKQVVIKTQPSNVEVPVQIVFHHWDDEDMQFVTAQVDNPLQDCKVGYTTFPDMLGLGKNCHDTKYLGDHRMSFGGNTTLHGVTKEDAEVLGDLMIEAIKDLLYYRK